MPCSSGWSLRSWTNTLTMFRMESTCITNKHIITISTHNALLLWLITPILDQHTDNVQNGVHLYNKCINYTSFHILEILLAEDKPIHVNKNVDLNCHVITNGHQIATCTNNDWFSIQWWFVNPGSDNPEISLIRTKSAGTDFRFLNDGWFSNPENSFIRKFRQGTNVSGLTNHHCILTWSVMYNTQIKCIKTQEPDKSLY